MHSFILCVRAKSAVKAGIVSVLSVCLRVSPCKISTRRQNGLAKAASNALHAAEQLNQVTACAAVVRGVY